MKKIMFNDKFLLTQAVLDGRKTQTRRIVSQKEMDKISLFQKEYYDATFDKLEGVELLAHYFLPEKCGKLPYNVGEVVAVAQSYKELDALYNAAFNRKHSVHGMTFNMLDCVPDWEIKKWFDIRKQFAKKASWKNKMFVKAEYMPHQIRITNVRVEKLEDISEQDAIAEGITYVGPTYDDYGETMFVFDGCKKEFSSARDAYACLIDKISGKGTWVSNPYVFVYDFEIIK